MFRLTISLAAVMAAGLQAGEKNSPPAVLEGAAVVEGENLRCTITVVTPVPRTKGKKDPDTPHIARTVVSAPLKDVRAYVVAAGGIRRKVDAAGLRILLKDDTRVYFVNGRDLDAAPAGHLKQGSIVVKLPK